MFNNNSVFAIVAFFQLYGVKIFGVIDTSLLVLLVVILLSSQFKIKKISFDKRFIVLIFLIAVIAVYTLCMLVLNEVYEFYSFFRLLRALLSTILIMVYLHFSNIGENVAIRILIFCIALHALMLLLQVFIPSVKEVTALIVGYDKELIEMRSFGLVSAYDTAGAYLLIGMILSAYLVFIYKKHFYFMFVMFFWVAGMVTGRSFMVFGTLLFMLLTYLYIIRVRRHVISKATLALFLVVFSVIFIEYVFPLLEASFRFVLDENYSPMPKLSGSGYYIGTLSVLADHVLFPGDESVLVFGGAEIPASTDIGYIKLIHSVGVFGLFFYFIVYYKAYSYVRKYNKSGAIYLFLPLLIITFMYNYKMLTFASRGYHELIVLLMLLLVGVGTRGGRYVNRLAT